MPPSDTTAAPHPFRPDFPAEPGYRCRCLVCGAEKHPDPIPTPRKATP